MNVELRVCMLHHSASYPDLDSAGITVKSALARVELIEEGRFQILGLLQGCRLRATEAAVQASSHTMAVLH